VETLAPLVGIHAAVTRENPEGGPPWRPEQCLSLADALRAYSVGAAAASADPEATGTLTPGAPADFVVVSGDPFALPASELLSLQVVATGVGGRWAFRAPGFPSGTA
jgi:predicted amidohydrolase YtcJ